jgi:hypothetical protein
MKSSLQGLRFRLPVPAAGYLFGLSMQIGAIKASQLFVAADTPGCTKNDPPERGLAGRVLAIGAGMDGCGRRSKPVRRDQ